MSFTVDYTDNTDAFLKLLESKTQSALKSVKEVLDPAIDANTPFDTGALKASRESRIEGDELVYIYNMYYAVYVYFGTYKQYPQPWILETVTAMVQQLTRIVVKELMV